MHNSNLKISLAIEITFSELLSIKIKPCYETKETFSTNEVKSRLPVDTSKEREHDS